MVNIVILSKRVYIALNLQVILSGANLFALVLQVILSEEAQALGLQVILSGANLFVLVLQVILSKEAQASQSKNLDCSITRASNAIKASPVHLWGKLAP